jgi:hypothetical protein
VCRFGLPVLPLIVGGILGPVAEQQGRMALQLTGGDASGLIGGPCPMWSMPSSLRFCCGRLSGRPSRGCGSGARSELRAAGRHRITEAGH